jgi:VanZ family protein
VWRALVIVAVLIVYGCLYPFAFQPPPPGGWSIFWHNWPLALTRFVARDAIVNMLLYAPFGDLAFLALDRQQNISLQLLIPVLLACCLSITLEFIQLMDSTRNSSLFDVACNTAGAALGAITGRFYAGPVTRFVTRTEQGVTRAPTVPLMLFCVWAGYQVFPIFPSVGRFLLWAKIRALFVDSSFTIANAISTSIEWLAAAAVLRSVFPNKPARISIFALLLLLPARIFLIRRSVALSELTGALCACILWRCWLERRPRPAPLLRWLIVAGLVLQDLSPFRLSRAPQSFSWTPFAGFLGSIPDWGAVMLLKKSFWYGAAVWTFHEAGGGYLRPALGIAALLTALEWTQRYLPGRTPEISDPVLALLFAAIMSLIQNRSSTGAPQDISRSKSTKVG